MDNNIMSSTVVPTAVTSSDTVPLAPTSVAAFAPASNASSSMPSDAVVALTSVRLKLLPRKSSDITVEWVTNEDNWKELKKVLPHLEEGKHSTNAASAKLYHTSVSNKIITLDNKNMAKLAREFKLIDKSTGVYLQNKNEIVTAALSNDDQLDFDQWLHRAVGVVKAPYSGDSHHTAWLKEGEEKIKRELKIDFYSQGSERVSFIAEMAKDSLSESRGQAFRRQMRLHFPDRTWVERKGPEKDSKAKKDGKILTWTRRTVHGIRGFEGTYNSKDCLARTAILAQIGDVVNKANMADVSLDDLLTMLKEVHKQIEVDGRKVRVDCIFSLVRYLNPTSQLHCLSPNVSPSKRLLRRRMVADRMKCQRRRIRQKESTILSMPQLMMGTPPPPPGPLKVYSLQQIRRITGLVKKITKATPLLKGILPSFMIVLIGFFPLWGRETEAMMKTKKMAPGQGPMMICGGLVYETQTVV